jgi:peptidoglycan/LPS O-acetylase OafA/YrhL
MNIVKGGIFAMDKKNSSGQKTKKPHIDILDGLRGIAILMVVLYHVWLITWLDHSINLAGININLNFFPETGFLGVELFFFISAFCLFYPYARYMFEEYKFQTVKEFTYRRFIKIIPSYYLSILLIMVFFQPNLGTLKDTLWNILTHMLLIHNFFPETFGTINGVFWSLGVEVQFYLVFPFLCMLFRKRPFTVFAVMSGIAVFYRYYICFNFPDHADSYLLNQLPGFLDLFAFGMLAAYLLVYLRNHMKFQEKLAPFFTMLAVIMFALFLAILSWFEQIKGIENSVLIWQIGNRPYFGFIFLVLTISSAFSLKIWRTILANKVLVFLSVISYNLYIWHQLLANKVNEWKLIPAATSDPRSDHGWQILFSIGAILVGVAFSALVTYVFERPILKKGFKKFWTEILDYIKGIGKSNSKLEKEQA